MWRRSIPALCWVHRHCHPAVGNGLTSGRCSVPALCPAIKRRPKNMDTNSRVFGLWSDFFHCFLCPCFLSCLCDAEGKRRSSSFMVLCVHSSETIRLIRDGRMKGVGVEREMEIIYLVPVATLSAPEWLLH